jgi:hypothetical protein
MISERIPLVQSKHNLWLSLCVSPVTARMISERIPLVKIKHNLIMISELWQYINGRRRPT